ncbi:hypothetical protein C0Q70_05262 [Pomacea canaliculata]|uniref:Uncharacterized protein n=1 Tax=Pomacea canaliculata TaxID=400727 RepID=A0A2T7PKR8_POMCA|nr:hypothetical protein C0Q70_05262 [Pomacea canaliculata]
MRKKKKEEKEEEEVEEKDEEEEKEEEEKLKPRNAIRCNRAQNARMVPWSCISKESLRTETMEKRRKEESRNSGENETMRINGLLGQIINDSDRAPAMMMINRQANLQHTSQSTPAAS